MWSEKTGTLNYTVFIFGGWRKRLDAHSFNNFSLHENLPRLLYSDRLCNRMAIVPEVGDCPKCAVN